MSFTNIILKLIYISEVIIFHYYISWCYKLDMILNKLEYIFIMFQLHARQCSWLYVVNNVLMSISGKFLYNHISLISLNIFVIAQL